MRRKGSEVWSAVALLSLCLMIASCTTQMSSDFGDAKRISAAGPEIAAASPSTTAGSTDLSAKASPPVKLTGRFTLKDIARRAVGWHPAIDQAAAKLNQSDQNIRVARAGYYPKISGGLNSGYDSTTVDDEGWRPKLNVGVSQMIYDFGKVSSSVDIQTAGAGISRAELLLAVDNLVRDAAYAMIEVQRNRALRAVAREQLAGVKAIAKLVEQRSDKGASTRSDKVQAEARVEAAQSTILQISSDLGRWESGLASLVGSNGPVPISPGIPAWLSKTCNVGTPDWSQVPSVIEAKSQKKQALAQLHQARAQALPTLSLEAGASYDINQSRSEFLGYDPRRPQFSAGLNVSSSLYDAANAPRKDAADAALKAAEAAERNARYETGRDLAEAQSQTVSLRQLQGSLSSHVGMMRETRSLYERQYVELGTRTLLDLLNAEQELHSAQFDVVNTEHDLRRLDIDCLFNSGLTRKAFGLEGTVIRGVSL